MDGSKGEAFSCNASESTGTVDQESANEGKVGGEEGGPNNGDDIMVEVLGSHVYVDGICASDGGGAPGNSLNDEVVGGQDNYAEARRDEDGEGKEVISRGEGGADMLKSMQEDEVKRDGGRDEGDGLGVQGVSVINSAEDKKQDTVATSASGRPTELAVEDQLANKVQSDKTEQLEFDKQVFGSEQQLMEIERHSASSEIHHTGSSNSDMVDLFPEERGSQLKTEASLGPDTAEDNPSIEEETKFERLVGDDDQKVNLGQDQEVQVNEASVEMVGDGTEDTGVGLADSASLASKSNLLQSLAGDLGDVDMQSSSGASINGDHEKLAERDQQQISGDEDVTSSHSGGQDRHFEESFIGDELNDRHSGQENNGEEQEIDQEQDDNAEEETKRQTAPGSPVKLHYARYELPREDGEFCVSDLVWGKVRSHPWWPGQIFDPSDASEMAIKHHKKDGFLVAYFGDRTFAWNEASVLKPFRAHFSAAEKQNSSETFQSAVNCALEEIFRRVQSGLACSCSPKDFYDKAKFQVVQNTGIRQESSVKDVSERFFTSVSFEPDNLLQYIKGLAQFPCGGADKIDIAIAKAQLSAFYCLRGYHPLPEFRSGRGLVEADTRSEEGFHSDNITDHPSPMDLDDERVSSARMNSEPKRSSYHKRKHDLKGGLYPSKRERILSELIGGTFDSLDTDGFDGKPEQMLASPSSSKKRKTVDSFTEEVVEEGRTISLAKVSLTQPPKPSFKIGECISRVASQMTGSPSVLKGPCDRLQKLNGVNGDAADGIDLPSETYEDAIRKFSSSDQLLSELRLAASDPMKDFSFLNVVVSFFHDFRNSLVLDHLPGYKEGGKRKRLSNSVIGSAETFEFEDMSDTYWTDRIVQNGSEEQLPHGNGRGQYQTVPVELEKPVQRGRKSRKRYSDGNRGAVAEKPPGYVNEKAPAELVMTFSELNSVPSEAKLNKMFRHFGPLKESETDVDWETSRARVVFRRCSDAEVALNSAEKFNIFGPVVVKYQLNYSISESFKASLYAPVLPEETQIVTRSLDEHSPLIGSTPGNHNQLIVSTLGEDASFMVSTLADESLSLPSAFGEQTSYMTVTLAEETSNVTAHAGEGTFTITTTACMETLAAGISENGTVDEQTTPRATDPFEQRIISDTTMGEQGSNITASLGEEASDMAASFAQESFVPRLLAEGSLNADTTLGEVTLTTSTSFEEKTSAVPAMSGEEIAVGPTTSGGEMFVDVSSLDDKSDTEVTKAGEMLPLDASPGEEMVAVAASSAEESLAAPATSIEGASAVLATSSEEPSAVPATTGEDLSAAAMASAKETSHVPATAGEDLSAAPMASGEETSAVAATAGEGLSAFPMASGEETLAVPETTGDDLSAAPMASSEDTLAVPATTGEDLSAAPVASGEETSPVPGTAGEDLSAVPMVSDEETLAVPATAGGDLSAVPMASDEETSAVPRTTSEDLSAARMASGEETSAVPATTDEDLSAAPMASGEKTLAALATEDEDLPDAPMASGEETSAVTATAGQDLSAAPVASGYKISDVPVTTGEDLSATPVASVGETSAIPATTGDDLSAGLMAYGEETSAVPVTMGDDLSAAPMVSGEETSAVPATTGDDLSAVPMAPSEETSAVPMLCDDKTLAVPATTGEDLSAVPVLCDDETSAVPVGSGEETLAAPVVSGEETSAVPAHSSNEPSVVPVVAGEETSVVPVVSGEKTATIPVASSEATSSVPATNDDRTSAVPTTSSGGKRPSVSDPCDQSLTIGTTAEETLSFAATVNEENLNVDMTSIVTSTLAVGISTIATATGDGTSSSLTTLGQATSPVITSVNETPSTVTMTLHEASSTIATIGDEATSTVPMTLDETSSTVTAASDMETAFAETTQVEEYAA